MTRDEVAAIVAHGREQPNVEFKGPGPRTNQFLMSRITRAALGMANRRDGGYVVIGVDEAAGGLANTGIDAADLPTWQQDHVARVFSNYADPAIEFTLDRLELDGRMLVVLTIAEFRDVPLLCKRPYTHAGSVVLKDGACYIRPRGRTETAEVSSAADMRDLLDLATEKQVRRFLAQAQAVGLPVGANVVDAPDDAYARERGDIE